MIGQDSTWDFPASVFIHRCRCLPAQRPLEYHSQGVMLPKSLSSSRLRSCTLGGRHFEASGQRSLALCSQHPSGWQRLKSRERFPQKARKQKVKCNARKIPLCRNRLTSVAQRVFGLQQTQLSACSLPTSRCQNPRDQSRAAPHLPTARQSPWASPRVAPPALPAVIGSKSRELTYPGCSKGIIPDLIS